MQVRDNGASSWFNAVALEEQDLTLNRRQFRDSLHLHYNLQLADLPSHCSCGDRFTVSHALSCKKTDFVAQRHDRIQNLLTFLLSKICKEVEVEPMRHSTQDPPSQVRPEARQDIKAESFWSRGETAFFDVYFRYVNSTCNQNKSKELIFVEHENEKKRKYQSYWGKSY